MLPLEGISGGKGVGPAVTDVIMVVRNILIIVFPVEEVIHSKLESEVLIELVIGGKVHEEIGIPSLEAAAFLSCFRPVGNEHAVQVHRPGILAVRSTKVEQMAGNVIILFTLHLSCLPGVVDVGSPGVTVVLVQGNFKSMGLGVALIFIHLIGTCRCTFRCSDFYRIPNIILCLCIEYIGMNISLSTKFLFQPQFPSIGSLWVKIRILPVICPISIRISVNLVKDWRIERSAIRQISIRIIIKCIV